jgi:hypothetical protein
LRNGIRRGCARRKRSLAVGLNRADMINNLKREDKGCLFDLRDKRSLNGFFDRLPCRCAPCLYYITGFPVDGEGLAKKLVSEEKWKTKLFGLNLNLT